MDNRAFRTLKYQENGYCRVVGLSGASDKEEEGLLFVELAEACDRIAWDQDARVVVFTFDKNLKSLPGVEGFQSDDLEKSSLAESVAKLRQPVIAAIEGEAIGSGLELALACDIRIGTENARFGFPQITEASIPSNGGTQRLPRLIGYAKAMEMILTGEFIDADEAQRVGGRLVRMERGHLVGT